MAIVLKGDFKPSDPFNIYKDRANPLDPRPVEPAVDPVAARFAEEQSAAQLSNQQAEQDFQQLEAEKPGQYQLIDETGLDAWQQEWQAQQPGWLEDTARILGGAVGKGVGVSISGLGNAITALGNITTTPIINNIFGTDYGRMNPLAVPGEWVSTLGEKAQEGVSFATREAIANSTPDGDILDPGSWTLGTEPSLVGYAALTLDVFGQMAPIIAASIAAGPAAGAIVGGLQGGGAASQQAEALIDQMASQPGLLERESAYYREQIAAGKSHEQAVASTRAAAGQAAFILTAPISGLGGYATARIIDPATVVLAGRNIVARMAGKAGLSALEEGTQEAAESVATNLGINSAAGMDQSLTEGTFADFMLGALAGGGTGAVAGAFGGRAETAAAAPMQQGAATPEEMATAIPVDVVGSEDQAAQPAPVAPTGPMTRALEHGLSNAPSPEAGKVFVINDPALPGMGSGPGHGETAIMAPNQAGIDPNMRRVILEDGTERIIGTRLLSPVEGEPLKKDPQNTLTPLETSPFMQGKPDAGSRVMVDMPGLPAFNGRVEQYVSGEQSAEALVVDDNGEVLQIPVEYLSSLNLSPEQLRAAEAEDAPPIERETVPAGPTVRRIDGASMQFPDATHADLFDLAYGRRQMERLERGPGGAGALKAREHSMDPQRVAKVADELGILPERVGAMADEYLYWAEKAAKGANSDLPQNLPSVDAKKLAEWRAERDKAEAQVDEVIPTEVPLPPEVPASKADEAILSDDAAWWDALPPGARTALLASAKVKRSANSSWDKFTKPIKAKLSALREGQKALDRPATNPLEGAPEPADLQSELEAPSELDKALAKLATEEEVRDAAARAMNHGEGRSFPDQEEYQVDMAVERWKLRRQTEAAAAIDDAAHQAATSPNNDRPEPTQAQKEAGNYAMGHHVLGGLDLSIENPAGSERKGADKSGKPWSVMMESHYGYIKGTVGKDKDHIDVFVKPGTDNLTDDAPVFVVNQVNEAGRFDEHKVMLGFDTQAAAEAAYLANYTKGWTGMGRVAPVTLAEFKAWLKSGNTTKPMGATTTDINLEAKSADPETTTVTPAPAASQPKVKLRVKAPRAIDRAENFFRPGREIGGGYWGGADKVVSFERLAGGQWSVTVESTEDGSRRSHSTQPSEKELLAWEKDNPIAPVEVKEKAPREPIEPPKEWGASNKLVSQDRATELRKRLREKLSGNQLNAGIDPEILSIGAELAAFHIEAGARRFADFAGAMSADLGKSLGELRPYLRAWYNGARDLMEDSGVDVTGTDSAEVVRAELARLTEAAAHDRTNRPEVARPDPAGVDRAPGGRDRVAQSGSAQADRGDVEADQPDLLAPTSGGRDGGEAGLRGATADVDRAGRPDGGGDAGNGRTRAGGAEPADAGAGRRAEPGARLPDVDARAGVKSPKSVSPANEGPGNFHIADPLAIVGGGQVARFEKNKIAVELANTLRDESRAATREEQAILAGYTGWGSFGQDLFQGTWENPRPKQGWEARDKWLRANVGQEEWQSLQRSIANAHYTDPPTVMAMWAMAHRMGFNGGRVLEPSMGIGNFFGMMPADLQQRSNLTGIELDQVTGDMAKLLYPDANIAVMGFQDSKTPDNFYDMVIGNWPFADVVMADRRYNRLSPLLHDYFFLKAMDQVRPGGIVMGITSKGTMDKKESLIRTELAKKGELVAAFRLPSGAFQQYAGTAVVTDIIILRKRAEPAGMVADAGWIKSVPYETPSGRSVDLNEYYVSHPDHVVGTIDFGQTMHRPGMIVNRPEDMEGQLKRITALVPEAAYQPDTVTAKAIAYITNHTDDREGALTRGEDGSLQIVRGEHLVAATDVFKYALKSEAATQARTDQLNALIDMRKAYAELIANERNPEADPEPSRQALNKLYETFTTAHGPLSDSFGLTYLRRIDDPFYASLAALESKEGTKVKPAGILTASTTRAPRKIDKPSISDAFVLARNAAVDPSLEQIAEIAKASPEAVRKELLAKGAVFELPNGEVTPADIYLSGNVREKMRQARAGLEAGNAAMERNIEALTEVMPPDVPYFNIEVQFGASWVPTAVYEQYAAHMLGADSPEGINVTYAAGRWRVGLSDTLKNRPEAKANFGHQDYSFFKLVNAAISNQTVTVRVDDGKGTMVVDPTATAEVNGKIEKVRTEFGQWLWSDPARRYDLEAEYNEVRNAYATPSFDGSFLAFEGMALSLGNGPFDLRQHQVNAIWRGIVTRRSLNAHEVGTGKTFTMGGIAVESRRYGIAKKPLIFAHNANSKTVAAEIQQMYPGAKVLYIDNLAPAQIDVKMRQIANDDWDAVVVPHSLIDRFTLTEETLMAMAAEEIAALEAEAYAAAADDGATLDADMFDDEEAMKKVRSPTAKQLVKTRSRIIENIKKQSQRASKEGALSFEELGVDQILVDEVHEFKKPPFSTRMRIKGLNTQSSNKSIALAFLTKYIRGMNNGGNVHLFTGTPVTNTLTEVFHAMRYIMAEEMADSGVDQWDGWFGSFAKEVQDVELNAAAEYEAVTRLAGFINVPELRRMIGQYMDVVFSDDMPEMQPRRTDSGKTLDAPDLTEAERAQLLNGRTENAKDRPYKKVINETADLTPEQAEAFAKVQQYAAEWRSMSGKDKKEAMMAGAPQSPIIYEGLAAKASFDVRLNRGEALAGHEGRAPDNPNSKASRVVRNVAEIYRSHKLATQVIFTNSGISTTASRSVGEVGDKSAERYKVFSTVQDIIARLVAEGIPREQIATVDGSTSKDKRKAIADAMNTAEIRVVIGSTGALGVGVNMQKNLRAMHQMDAPWMPGDLEQRNGRGQRQGNQWNTVLEYRYLTDRIDGRRWQVLAIKQRFILAFLKSDDKTRIIEGDAASDDEGDILTTFSEAAGDPRVLIRAKLQKKIEQLKNRQRLYETGIVDAEKSAQRLERFNIEDAKEIAKKQPIADKVDAVVEATAGDNFKATVGGKVYAKRAEAIEALDDYVVEKDFKPGMTPAKVGELAGYPLQMRWGMFDSAPQLGLVVDGDLIEGGAGTLAALQNALRSYRERVEKMTPVIADRERSIERLRASTKEPFHQEAEQARIEAEFIALEKDMAENPVPPPAWLRQGAPVDTEVRWKGKTYVVSGHRWNADGWYVLASTDTDPLALPYLEVTDQQGMPLYEPHDFTAPVVIEKDKKPEDGTSPKADLDEDRQFSRRSIGALGRTVGAVRTELNRAGFGSLISGLEQGGRLRIVSANEASAADGEQGWTDADGSITLIADQIPEGEATAVLLHEAFHSGSRPLLGSRNWRTLMLRLAGLYRQFETSKGSAREFFDAARARVREAERLAGPLTEPLRVEEFAAYAIEEYASAPAALSRWVEDLLGEVKAWALQRWGRQLGAVTPAQLRGIAKAALRETVGIGDGVSQPASSRRAPPPRKSGFTPGLPSVASYANDRGIKAHADYQAAKAGDAQAAIRLVQDVIKPDSVEQAAAAFGTDVVYMPVIAVEASGHNAIPYMTAQFYAARTGATAGGGIAQINRAYHTGAGAMERLLVRALFDGPVEAGRKYVLVDDVTVMGSTLAELANHIRAGGGEVAGVVTLVNAARTDHIAARKEQLREIERRFGDVIREEFSIEPASLTGAEATYLLNFRDADRLRTRSAAAIRARVERLGQKGVRNTGTEVEPSSVKPNPDAGPRRRSMARNSSTSNVVHDAPSGWGTVENLPELLSEAEKERLTQLVRQASGLSAVEWHERIVVQDGNEQWGTDAPLEAAGFYDPARDVIALTTQWGNPKTALHEAFHRLQWLFLSDQEIKMLAGHEAELKKMLKGHRPDAQIEKMWPSELEADAFGLWASGAIDLSPPKGLAGAWRKIKALLNRSVNYLVGNGWQIPTDLFARAATGEIAARAPRERYKEGARRARSKQFSMAEGAGRALQGKLTMQNVGEEIAGKLTDLKPAMLAAIPLNYFSELKRPSMIAVDQYLKVKRYMDAYRGEKHAQVDKVAQLWRKYASIGFAGASPEGKTRAAALADLMHQSTLAGVDPSLTDEETQAKAGYAKLRAAYMALSPKGRELYGTVRDTYREQADELDAILLENVKKTQEIAFRRAEDKYREALAENEASSKSAIDKSMAERKIDDTFKGEMARATATMKARMTKLRIVFESSRVPAPYFPLGRFGRYYVSVKDIDGNVLSFSKRESEADRRRLERDMREAFPTAKIESGLLPEGQGARDMMDPRIVAEIETLLGGAGVDAKVMDMIWQRYLETMPDLSARKRFIHRKGVAGFEGDALRIFAHNQFHAAHQMARLKFGLELAELASQSVDQARKADDPVRGMVLANELKKRHDWVMNPTGSKAVQAVTSTMFVWYLAATPAAAIVNMTQTPMMGIPVLGARLGGIGKATAAIGKASVDLVRGRGTVTRANLTAGEKRAMQAFYESGMIDRTQAHDLAGVGETGIAYSPVRQKVMAVISWAFHQAEVWNREVTALAAYRMAREMGQHEGKAIDTAHELTWAAHFDYSNSSRPRLMQGDTAKLLFVFQSHQVNMWYRLMRDIHQSVKGESPQAKKEARYQLAGIIGMMTLFSGVTGLFGYNVLIALAGMFFDDDDDPRIFKDEFEGHIVELFGPDIAGVILKGAPGHLTKLDLTSRIGMADFFIRAPYGGSEGRDWFQELIVGAAGVVPATFLSTVDGIGQISSGNFARGVEVMAPKFIRDPMKAWRYANEGVLSRRGDVTIDRQNIDPWDVIAQLSGFTPAKVAETYERIGALKDAESNVVDQRRELMNRYALAYFNGDEAAKDRAVEAILAWNQKPYAAAMPITSKGLKASLATRMRNADKRDEGALISDPELSQMLREAMPARMY